MINSAMSEEFPCVLCDKKLASKTELQDHFRNHASTKSRPKKKTPPLVAKPGNSKGIACDVCAEVFANNTLAIQHKFRKHPEAQDKYHCPTCGMLFTIKTIYENHFASHKDTGNNADVVPCEVCDAKFNNKTALEYHVKATHKRVMKLYSPVVTAPPSKKIRLNNAGDVQSCYFCHICGSEYVVKFNLQKHLEQYHTEEQRSAVPSELIRCTVCDALFYNRKAYESHNLGHKPSDLYVPDEEARLRAITRIDQDFDYRRVMPVAEKYVPNYRSKPRSGRRQCKKLIVPSLVEADADLSPPSSPGMSSDGEDEERPLSTLRHIKEDTAANTNSIAVTSN